VLAFLAIVYEWKEGLSDFTDVSKRATSKKENFEKGKS